MNRIKQFFKRENKMKTLWIHAGMPKNGSSALQVFFAKNKDNLGSEDIDYLSLVNIKDAAVGQITSGNGALLARSLLGSSHESYYKDGGEQYEKFLDLVKESSCKNLIVSSEFFAVSPLNEIEKICRDLKSINVTTKFIYYVRRQDQFLMSSYMQRVKRHLSTESPEEYIENNYKNIHFLKYFGYAEQYSSLLGRENVYPFIFDDTKNHSKGIAGHFMNIIIGRCPDWVESSKSINTSPSPRELKLMLMANKYSPRMRFSDFLIQDSIIRGDSTHYKSHNLLSKKTLIEIFDYFEEQNIKFINEYCPDSKFDVIDFDNYIGLDLQDMKFTSEEVMDIISGFLVRFDRRISNLEGK